MNTIPVGVGQTPDLNNPNTHVDANLQPINIRVQDPSVNAVPMVAAEAPTNTQLQSEQVLSNEPIVAVEQVPIVEAVPAQETISVPMAPQVQEPVAISVVQPPIENNVVAPVIDEKTRISQAQAVVTGEPHTLAEMADFANRVDLLSNVEIQ